MTIPFGRLRGALLPVALCLALITNACTRATGESAAPAEAAAVPVTLTTAVEQPVTRFIRVSGTLTAEEDAEVAAEIAGRVVATPVERGTRVTSGGDLARIAAVEAEAQVREAQANAAQIEARLGIANGAAFEAERVPEVANARATHALARSDFERVRMLFEKQLLSQSEYDQRRAQVESAERQYDVARNGAEQQYQSLMAARARIAVAQKALADTVVRAPFAGVVGERFVSVGDYVTRGTRVASVMRIDPLRVELTVPEQYVSAVNAGSAVTFEVDAYPGETFTGQVRYVSPSVKAETRALMIEAVVPNQSSRLKPGFFVTARIEETAKLPGILVPAAAVRTVAGTARVFVVADDRAEERVVMTGQVVGDQIEIASGLNAGERIVTTGLEQVVDGVRVVSR